MASLKTATTEAAASTKATESATSKKPNYAKHGKNLQKSEFHLKLRDKNNLKGRCGVCEYREICGGCRTRAEYYTGDLFESDPACNYIPKVLREDPKYLEKLRADPMQKNL